MLTLHYAPRTVSAAVAITLNELGISYQMRALDFATADQTKPEYHKINPKGRVPALMTEQGVLTETIALLEYANSIAPQGKLVPQDAFKAAQMREVMTWLASTMHINHAMGGRGPRWGTQQSTFDDLKSKVTENMAANCAYIETTLLQGPFVVGDQMTLADPYLYTVSTWLKGDGIDIAAYPRFEAFQTMMAARPAVQAAQSAGFF